MSQGTDFDGGRELAVLINEQPLTGNLIRRIIQALNRGMTNAGVSVNGERPPLPPIDSIQVKGTMSNGVLTAPGEFLHFVHTHNAPLARGVQYVTEIDTSPNFPAPHPIDTGSSRSGFVNLPTLDDNGVQVNYYLRGIVQHVGSAPARPTVFGGVTGPIPIQMSGTTRATLLTSQAGGTMRPGQGGQGLGSVAFRGPVGGPKRTLSKRG